MKQNIHVPTNKPNKLVYNVTPDKYIGLSYYLDCNLVRKGFTDDKEYGKIRQQFKTNYRSL
jgi:hypothetical protein